MPTATLLPNGDVSNVGATTTEATFTEVLNRGTDPSPVTTKYIAFGANDSLVVDLESVASDWDDSNSITLVVFVYSSKNTTLALTAQLFESDGTTAITGTVDVTPTTTLTQYTLSEAMTVTGDDSKSAMDGARLKFTTASGAGGIFLYASDVDLDYNVAAGGSSNPWHYYAQLGEI